MKADPVFLDFVAECLRIFGPTARLRIEDEAGKVHRFNFPADPTWRPPAKRFNHDQTHALKNGSSRT